MRVGYDIQDASKVWVYDAEGRFVCTAEHNANERPYMPQSAIDKARDKRAAGRERRLETRLEEVRLERRGTPALEQMESVTIPGFLNINRDQLAQQAQAMLHARQEAEVVEIRNVVEVKEQVTAPAWTVPIDKEPQDRYAEWLRISKLREEELESERQKEWRLSYTKTAEFRVFSKKTA
jgi:putative transposase